MQLNNPLVTVGVPIVKTQFIRQAIECLMKQTYTKLHIVFLNNGRTQEVRDSIKTCIKEFNDVRVEYAENDKQLPIVENWNKVLSYAQGELFTILCDDDYWKPTFVEEMVALSIKYPLANIFHSRVLIVDEDNKPLTISPICPEYEDFLDFILGRIKEYRLQYLSDFVVRTVAINEIGGFANLNSGWGSDDLTWYQIARNGGVAYSPKLLFHYRESALSVTNSTALATKILATKQFINETRKIVITHLGTNAEDDVKINVILSSFEAMINNRINRYTIDLLTARNIHSAILRKLYIPFYKKIIRRKYKL